MLYKGDTLYLNWLEDGIAELVFDAPGSVNKLDTATVASLGQALDVLEKQTELKGLLLRSNKAAFIVGADITEFLSLFLVPEEQLSQWLHFANSVFNRLEDLPVPTISAVNGYALGGGCECVLATDYRLATPDLRIGLPETKLGIMPGFGGSVRMPRMLGADSALEIIAAGKDVSAEQAQKIGLVDGVVKPEKLVEGALAILRQAINGELDWKAKRQPKLEPLKLSKIEATMSFTIAKGMVMQTAGKHYPAPITAVKTIEAAARLGRDEALKLENQSFVPLAHTNEARALVGIFLNDQFVKGKAKQLTKNVETPKHAAVLGAGIMGGGIAYQSAWKGVPVVMKDISEKDRYDVIKFLADTDQFFLNIMMATGKAVMDDARKGTDGTIVTAMCRNGYEFGIRIAGMGDEWFTGPVNTPQGLYFTGYDADDACPDMGDSAITETFGVGGMAMIAAPAVTRFVGAGGYEDALRTSNEMMEIVTDRNPNFTVPTWNFQGICLGIDARLVVEKGITPVINTGIANKVAGKGQIGAGTVHPPIECFEKAIVAYAKKLGFEA